MRAEPLKGEVWGFVSGLLKDPSRVRTGLDEMIEQEREGAYGDPDKETGVWMEKLYEADCLRAGYQELGAKGLMTLAELGERLAGLDEMRKAAQRELAALKGRRERLQELKRDRDAFVEHYAGLVPEALDALSAEERHRVYRLLRLRVMVNRDGSVEVTGALGTGLDLCALETTSG
jgi:hypothetical protein